MCLSMQRMADAVDKVFSQIVYRAVTPLTPVCVASERVTTVELHYMIAQLFHVYGRVAQEGVLVN